MSSPLDELVSILADKAVSEYMKEIARPATNEARQEQLRSGQDAAKTQSHDED